jgi:hypothetical protein
MNKEFCINFKMIPPIILIRVKIRSVNDTNGKTRMDSFIIVSRYVYFSKSS